MTPSPNIPTDSYQPHRIGLHSDDKPYPGEEMCYCDKPKPTEPYDQQIDEILLTLENEVALDMNRRFNQHSSGKSPKSSHAEAKTKLHQLVNEKIRTVRRKDERWFAQVEKDARIDELNKLVLSGNGNDVIHTRIAELREQ